MALTSQRFIRNTRLQTAAANSPVMKKNESGDAVALLQDALIDVGFSMPLSTSNGQALPDGIFGSETKSKVMKFQDREHLVADGIAGRNTLHALDRYFQHENEYYLFKYARYVDGWSTTTSKDKREG